VWMMRNRMNDVSLEGEYSGNIRNIIDPSTRLIFPLVCRAFQADSPRNIHANEVS
jgi:hypothetical protein